MEAWLDPLLDAEAMRAIDRWAIDEQGVPSLELMEAAGAALAAGVEELRPDGPVRVVCGKGNNGGDGLVAARLLAGAGFDVEVLLLWPAGELSDDATANLERFDESVRELAEGEAAAALRGSRRGRRRDLRHGFLRRPARAGRERDRGDQRMRRTGRRRQTSPPVSTPRPARSRGSPSRHRSP